MWAALLLAVGSAAIFIADNIPSWFFSQLPIELVRGFNVASALSGFASVGAAIGAPFKRKMLGCVAGAILYGSLLLIVHF